MGEILACLELARGIKARFPQSALLVSTATLAGRATAEQKLAGIADGVFFAPVDYVWVVRRMLRTLRPALVVIAETELWPNLFREVHRTGAGLVIVNARISDEALPRYHRLRRIFPVVLPAVGRILAQTEEMQRRFTAIGGVRVTVAGNLKFDFTARPAGADSPVVQLLERLKPAKVWIAASTMADESIDEDDAVIAAWRGIPGLFLILVPRKPERFDVVAAKLEAAGIRYLRRSRLGSDAAADAEPARVLLLDSVGELSSLFGLADCVFMGGTLAARGGHNILEPALFGKPVIVGPHMENFQAIADELSGVRALVEISGAAALGGAVARMLTDDSGTGDRARACAEARRGATARTLDAFEELYAVPRYRPAMPWFAVARLLSLAWRAEAGRRQRRDYLRRRWLEAPVVSIGNLSMGGTGKTPCVLRLAELLRAQGHQPGILTRGYGRISPVKELALAAGATVRTEESGDEPQMFLRSRLAPVGIGADRYRAGVLLRERFHTDILLLDDGFQHVRLGRSCDLVLVDALNPFGGGEVFPVGRLREPVYGLARAHAVIITRSEASDAARAIGREVHHWHPHLPVFRARIEPECWVEHRTGRSFPVTELRPEAAGAFCGLGNPQSFYRTLQLLGVEPLGRVEFEDHHRYKANELKRTGQHFERAGAKCLVTTEKDAINLPEGADELLGALPLYWLKVVMRVDDEARLVELILERCR